MKASYDILVYPGPEVPKAYHNMILSKWLRTNYFGNPFMREISQDFYWDCHSVLIKRVVNNPDSQVRLAALSDDHDVILGFSVSRPNILDYLWVHAMHRMIGIGSSLVPKFDMYTHTTNKWRLIQRHKYFDTKFNPYI